MRKTMKKKIILFWAVPLSFFVFFIVTWTWLRLSFINDSLDDNSSIFKTTTILLYSLFDKHEMFYSDAMTETISLILALIDLKSEYTIYHYKNEKYFNKYYRTNSEHDVHVDILQSLDYTNLNCFEIRTSVDKLQRMKSFDDFDFFNKRVRRDIKFMETMRNGMAEKKGGYGWFIGIIIACFDKQERMRYFHLDDEDRILLAIISIHFKTIFFDELKLVGERGWEMDSLIPTEEDSEGLEIQFNL